MEYDVIGDIHGQADKLFALLGKLGYAQGAGGWMAPAGRQAVFVGDLIDRGPQQVAVVDTVRRMVDAGAAHCVMGNHEFNAIAWATRREGPGSEFLRDHDERNAKQHGEFLAQVGEGSALHRELLDWFRTLPVALDLGPIRAVHAWWHRPFVEALPTRAAGQRLEDAFLQRACTRGTPEWEAMEGLTKGLELPLPAGASFRDHEGVQRHDVRARWWDAEAATYRAVAVVPDVERAAIPETALPRRMDAVTDKPVFVGHYWMTGEPGVQAPRVVCVDYSAAKEGPLVAYQWRGEDVLRAGNFMKGG